MAKSTKPNNVRIDNGYMNAFLTRSRMSSSRAEMMAGSALFNQQQLESQYIHNGFARLICDKPAEEMTRAGFSIVGMDEGAVKDIEARLEELEANKRFNEAIKWRRAFGGGLIVMGVDDGSNDTMSPVNEDSVKGVDFLRVYDRFEAFESKRYDDINSPKFGEIELYQVNPQTGGQSYQIHESRVLVFDGESVPNSVRIANQGWGASVIQNCFVQLVRLDTSYKLSLLLLERMQQAVHGIPNLSDMIATAEGEKLVTKRIQVVDAVRGALNTVVIDAEETYDVKSQSLSGVNEIMDRNAEALASVCSIPVYIIMGRSVGGLNATGESSRKGWESQVGAWQNDQARKPWDRLITLLRLGFSEGATDGDDYTIKFNPLNTPSEAEQIALDKTQAETLQIYLSNQVMDQDEARTIVADKFNLIGDAPEPEPEPDPILDPIKLKEGEKLVPHPSAKPIVGTKVPAK